MISQNASVGKGSIKGSLTLGRGMAGKGIREMAGKAEKFGVPEDGDGSVAVRGIVAQRRRRKE